MTNMAVNQRRWLLRMQSSDSQMSTHQPVEVPDQHIPSKHQLQQRTKRTPQSPPTQQLQLAKTPPKVR